MADATYFLNVSGVPGESNSPGHEGWIEAISSSLENSQIGTGGKGTGSGTGRAKFEEVQVVIPDGKYSGELLKAHASGKHYSTVMVDLTRGAETIRTVLNDCLVSSFQYQEAGEGDPIPLDVVVFTSKHGVDVKKIPTPAPNPGLGKSAAAGATSTATGTAPGTPSSGPKQAVLHVRVVDGKGTERVPNGKDKVTVAGNPLKYDSTKGFEHPLSGKGDLILKIEYDGFESLEQTFHFEAPAERPKLLPFWYGNRNDADLRSVTREGFILACMNLNRTAGGFDNQRSPKVFNLTVTLQPTRTYVAVLGTDYWEDPLGKPKRKSLDFREYAVTYAKHLTATNVLNVSSALIMMDCQRGRIERWDRVTGGGWQRHFTIEQFQPAPAWPKAADFVAWRAPLDGASAAKYLGAPQIYRHLSKLGQQLPGTVANFSVFSHAYQGGPILFNTIIDEAKKGRTEYDLDMRYWLDFVPPSVNGWSSMPKAFASDGTIHIWGCFNVETVADMARHLVDNNGNGKRFVDAIENLNLDRPGVAKYLRDTIANDSFMSRIAKFTGRRAFGSVPGFGADNIDYDKVPKMPQTLINQIDGQIAHVRVITGNERIRKLFESAELGNREFDYFGYMRYAP